MHRSPIFVQPSECIPSLQISICNSMSQQGMHTDEELGCLGEPLVSNWKSNGNLPWVQWKASETWETDFYQVNTNQKAMINEFELTLQFDWLVGWQTDWKIACLAHISFIDFISFMSLLPCNIKLTSHILHDPYAAWAFCLAALNLHHINLFICFVCFWICLDFFYLMDGRTDGRMAGWLAGWMNGWNG